MSSCIISRLFSIIIVFSLFTQFSYSQTKMLLEFGSGTEIAKWNISVNVPPNSIDMTLNTSGWKNSIPLLTAFYLDFGSVHAGLEVKNQYLLITELENSTGDDTGNDLSLSNSSGFLNTMIHLSIRVPLISKESYSLIPGFGVGTFIENSDYQNGFPINSKVSYKVAVQNQFQLKKYYLFVTPHYLRNSFDESLLDHKIEGIGIEIGIGIPLGKSS